jgi:hypothetical protein
MSANPFQNISKIEASLWEAADQLRANSKLTSSEYCMPVLGVIFLRHASNRYDAAWPSRPTRRPADAKARPSERPTSSSAAR